jgi:hypothetical protein
VNHASKSAVGLQGASDRDRFLMSKISISVAMAPYNGERLLLGQLDSLARSTLLLFRYLPTSLVPRGALCGPCRLASQCAEAALSTCGAELSGAR